MKNRFPLFVLLVVVLCQCKPGAQPNISKREMFEIVKSLDNQFSVGVQNKDSALLTNIYADSAQYVQPNRAIIAGKTEIGKDWAGFLKMKEKPSDLILIPRDVSGNREIIYEAGTGYTLLADSTKWNFNYVNVWRLQKDDTYKLEIDTFTPMDH